VRDIQPTIGSSLEGTKNSVSSSGRFTSYIQKCTEGLLVIIHFVHEIFLLVVFGGDDASVNFGVSLIDIIQADLLQKSTSTEETSAIGSGVVLQTDLKSITGQLSGLGLTEDAVSIDQGVRDLANNLRVGETNNEAVLWRLVLVFVLRAKTLTLTVISLSLATTTEFDLVPRVVRLGLLSFDERLKQGINGGFG
jgi:hypothetical protein